MTSLSSLFSTVDYLKNASIINIFPSKKNTVALIKNEGKNFVLKWYKPRFQQSFSQDCAVLKENNTPFHKPELLSINKDYKFLLLEYIPSENLCNLINDQNRQTQNKLSIITHLASWFYQFHRYYQQQSKPLIHGDANLRNFLISQNKNIYGLDFEESKPGNVREDIAFICASILTTNPSFTEEKQQLQHQFVKTYEQRSNQKIKDISLLVRNAVKKTIERRKNKKSK
jgi:tRNA A-37 threonylcarbamoyl transferase component Bud32